ncbi:hypothetical protein SCB49_05827 [unidentified eubacterium SCB49]|nr:hypothetical protein SCB49_05827 [unidentified eubacterium SCB49]
MIFVSLVATLFNGVQLFAQTNGISEAPPTPDERTPIPIEILPIDENIVYLFIAGLLLGVYYVYLVHFAKKKAA